VTLLDREIVDAVSIAAATAAMLVAGRREERSSFVRRQSRGRSRLATASALGVVALLAAVGVVAVFGPLRARGTKAAPVPVAVRVSRGADIPLPRASPRPASGDVVAFRIRRQRRGPRPTRCAFASGLCG
jgi:hypothetical protein